MANYSFKNMVKKYVSSSTVPILFSLFALVCANSPLKELYFQIWDTPMGLSVGDFNFFSHGGHAMSLMAVINDFLMVIFFLSVGWRLNEKFLWANFPLHKKPCYPLLVRVVVC